MSKLDEGAPCPIIQVVNEDVKSICHSIDLWGTPLVCLGMLLPFCVASLGDAGVVQVP